MRGWVVDWAVNFRRTGSKRPVRFRRSARSDNRFTFFGRPYDQAVEQQNGEHGPVLQRFVLVGLHQPEIVHDTEDGGEIDEAMEAMPILAAEAADGTGGRGEGEGNHEHEGGESHGDEGALEDVFPYFMEVEEFVEPDVGEEVEHSVEEGE